MARLFYLFFFNLALLSIKGAGNSASEFSSTMLSFWAFDAFVSLKYLLGKYILNVKPPPPLHFFFFGIHLKDCLCFSFKKFQGNMGWNGTVGGMAQWEEWVVALPVSNMYAYWVGWEGEVLDKMKYSNHNKDFCSNLSIIH